MAPQRTRCVRTTLVGLARRVAKQVGTAECEEAVRAQEIYSGCGHPARKDKVAKSDAGASVGLEPPISSSTTVIRIKAGTDVASIFARREMNLFGTEVLLVGQTFLGANGLAGRLHRWGLQCRYARNLREASDLLSLQPVDLVLSNVHLSDGTPFRLLTGLAGLPVTAFLCLPVEMSCFWLPALDAGEECLGKPALRPTEFSSVLKEMARRLATAPSVDWRESTSLPRAKNGFH